MERLICDYCGEEIDGEPVRRGSKVYCCEACAFEATRSVDCSGRGAHFGPPIVEFESQTGGANE